MMVTFYNKMLNSKPLRSISTATTTRPSFHHHHHLPINNNNDKSNTYNSNNSHDEAMNHHHHRDSMIIIKQIFSAVTQNNLTQVSNFVKNNKFPIDTIINSENGDTILLLACRLGFVDIVKLALDLGAKNDPHPSFGRTGLQTACASGQIDCIRILLNVASQSNSDRFIVNHLDETGESPLHVASRCGNIHVLHLLIDHGLDITLVDSKSRTCLHASAFAGHDRCLDYLVQMGAGMLLDCEDDDGLTCLHLAIKSNCVSCVQYLLSIGADFQTPTPDGYSSIDLARYLRRHQIVRLLMTYSSKLRTTSVTHMYQHSARALPRPFALERNVNKFQGRRMSRRASQRTARFFERKRQMRNSYSDYESSSEDDLFSFANHMNIQSIHIPRTPRINCARGSQHAGPLHCQSPGVSSFPRSQSNSPYSQIDSMKFDENFFNLNGEEWRIYVCPSSNHPYFVRVTDNHSQWEDPRKVNLIKTPALRDFDRLKDVSFSPKRSRKYNWDVLNNVDRRNPSHGSPDDSITTLLSAIKNNKNNTACRSFTISKDDSCESSSVSREVRNNKNSALPDPTSNLLAALRNRGNVPNNQHDQSFEIVSDGTKKNETDSIISKYEKMVTVGVPFTSVLHKMQIDGVDDDRINFFKLSINQSSNLKTSTPFTQLSAEKAPSTCDYVPKELSKYTKMVSLGVPILSVVHKMSYDGLTQQEISLFKSTVRSEVKCVDKESYCDNLPSPPSRKILISDTSASTKEQLKSDPALSKYVKMVSVGVPLHSVLGKMGLEEVSCEKINLFRSVYLIHKEESALSTSENIDTLPPKPPVVKRTSVKMQRIHWKPLEERELQNSLWVDGATDELIDDDEIVELESLFSYTDENAVKKLAPRKTKKQTYFSEVRLIEGKRANNIAIALAQYRDFKSLDELCEAVITQNRVHLNIEKLQNMSLLMPNANEKNTISNYKGDGKSGLGRAEQWFLALLKIPHFQQKLEAFILILEFDGIIEDIRRGIILLDGALKLILCNNHVSQMLKRVLAVGNILNESSGVRAVGIALGSLLSTVNKKGSDKKTTVLDHVVSTTLRKNDACLSFWLNETDILDEASKIDIQNSKSLFEELSARVGQCEVTLDLEKTEHEETTKMSGGDNNNTMNALVLNSNSSSVFIDRTSFFLKNATPKLLQVKNSLIKLDESIESLSHYFGEDPNVCKPDSIFKTLFQFAREISKSKQRIEEQKQRRDKKLLATSTTNNKKTSNSVGSKSVKQLPGRIGTMQEPISNKVPEFHTIMEELVRRSKTMIKKRKVEIQH